ncbi:MAG TPA: hypothetical protein VK964_11480 [Nocardioidaceae bacterium]|nr:hypothetical protein [Nocardioidaceae bacterium]
MPSDYRISPALSARILGALLALLGVAVVLLTLGVGLLDLPTAVLGVGIVVAVAVLLGGGLVLTRRATVVRLDDVGYRVRLVRGAGAPTARWADVEDVVAATVRGERCVVIRLRDGRTTTIPMRMLAADADTFVKDLQEHLNTGHGYRRLS